MAKPTKLTQVRVRVGKDVDMGKLITQIHTLLNRSKLGDRVEIYLNNEPVDQAPGQEEAPDTSLL